MKKIFFFGFSGCLFTVVTLNPTYSNVYFLAQTKKAISVASHQQPNSPKSSVELYKYEPQTGTNSQKNYLRFTISGYMYNYWLLALNDITAQPTADQKLAFFKLWTGLTPLANPKDRDLWAPVGNSLTEIYRNFGLRYNPTIGLQNILKDFLTSVDGFLKFYLTFVGQYRGNNFFPMGADYNEHTLQSECRKQGCVFQLPIIPDITLPNSYDVGPTVNILPDNAKNTYLKNFWRYVTIRSGAVFRNIWPIVTVEATPVPGEEVTVQQVLREVIIGVRQIFGILGMTIPGITIPTQYYDSHVPLYNPQGQAGFNTLEIGFDYWVSRFATYPYQNQLKIELVYKQP